MTTEQIDAIQAGLETDALVSEAIGINTESTTGQFHHPGFHPSTDWNDAMSAAERAGLFQPQTVEEPQYADAEVNQAFLCFEHDLWNIFNVNRSATVRHGFLFGKSFAGESFNHIAYDSSGPLAICKAILKLSARTNH